MKHKRRAKNVERDNLHPATDQQVISSQSTDGMRVSSRASPKTFEYKYFTRLLEEAGNGSHSHHLARRGNRLSSSFKEDTRNAHLHKNETNVQKLQAEKPASDEVPLLPTGRFAEKAMCEVPQLGAYEEPQPVNGGTFCTKRQNLIKRAASVLSLEEEEATSKGRALIPVLLRRLGINRNAENSDELQKINALGPNIEHPRVTYPYETLENMYIPSSARDPVKDQFFPIWSTTASDFPKRQRHSYSSMTARSPPPQNKLELSFSRTVEASTSRYTEPVFDHEIFHEEVSALSQRNSHVPLLSWDEMNDGGELSPASESPGKKQVYQWPLTLYNHGSVELPNSRPEFSQGSQWEDYLSADSYRDSLSSYSRPFRSTSSRLLLGSVDPEGETLAKKWSFYEQAVDEGDEDEGGGPSLVNWIDVDDA